MPVCLRWALPTSGPVHLVIRHLAEIIAAQGPTRSTGLHLIAQEAE